VRQSEASSDPDVRQGLRSTRERAVFPRKAHAMGRQSSLQGRLCASERTLGGGPRKNRSFPCPEKRLDSVKKNVARQNVSAHCGTVRCSDGHGHVNDRL